MLTTNLDVRPFMRWVRAFACSCCGTSPDAFVVFLLAYLRLVSGLRWVTAAIVALTAAIVFHVLFVVVLAAPLSPSLLGW